MEISGGDEGVYHHNFISVGSTALLQWNVLIEFACQ